MLYVYEFDVFENDGMLLALPFDFEGGTQGEDEREVAQMAADWLRVTIEDHLIHGREVPAATFGHESKEDGRVLIVAVEVSLDTIEKVPAHEAADMLDVSRGRVSQMVSSGQLDGFRVGRDSFVTVDSIKARLKDAPKAGRPKAHQ